MKGDCCKQYGWDCVNLGGWGEGELWRVSGGVCTCCPVCVPHTIDPINVRERRRTGSAGI